jgi:capsular exopolysaccharide synthesis family protein
MSNSPYSLESLLAPLDWNQKEAPIDSELQGIPVHRVTLPDEARLVVVGDPHSPGADRFRYLRLRLREARARRKQLQSVLITSALPKDGKSTVSLNLSACLADRGATKVLCIEADFYHRTLAETFDLERADGLGKILESGTDPMSGIVRIEPLGLYFLPAGTVQSSPPDLLHSGRVEQALATYRRHFDWIIVDAPPILAVTDPAVLCQNMDGALLIARAGQTPKEFVDEALQTLGEERTVGIILNDASDLNVSYKKYYGSYYYKKAK